MYCLYFRQYRPKEHNEMYAICFNYYSLKALSIPFYAIYTIQVLLYTLLGSASALGFIAYFIHLVLTLFFRHIVI